MCSNLHGLDVWLSEWVDAEESTVTAVAYF